MNRPNKKDDPNYPFEFPDTYLSELEKYCDFLEWKIEHLNEALNDHIKALDKACMQLEMLDERNGISADEWKAWAMKDE